MLGKRFLIITSQRFWTAVAAHACFLRCQRPFRHHPIGAIEIDHPRPSSSATYAIPVPFRPPVEERLQLSSTHHYLCSPSNRDAADFDGQVLRAAGIRFR
eukprot:TRINITY_DN29173_c0_g3_i2.p1 TRINITY_DN29173_c0_g3~~TRINITY_DN29173_c0_g3_i2.p1  ORF type:complete len:100 (+),score=6.15 TRINITY_DN29173_c0_g3_i2:209-508(+)